jgi:hypothetical protein
LIVTLHSPFPLFPVQGEKILPFCKRLDMLTVQSSI